jgi:hypothetical protein
MIPFRNSLPYDIIMKDVFALECPFCQKSNVLLPMKPADVNSIKGGARKWGVVFPCCHTRLQLVDADNDYLLADRPLR